MSAFGSGSIEQRFRLILRLGDELIGLGLTRVDAPLRLRICFGVLLCDRR